MIGSRIKLARTARGMNQRDLGQQTNLSAAAISKIETGLSHPTAEHLAAIASATGFDLSFFQRPARPLQPALYRKNSAMGVKRMDMIEALVEVHAEAFSCALAAAGAELPVRVPRLDRGDIEAAASEARRALGVPLDEPCDHLLAVMEQAGCAVIQLQWVDPNFDGFSTWSTDRPVVVLDRGTEGIGDRYRLTAAHELGHLILHKDGGVEHDAAEADANRFAGAFLLPKDSIARDFEKASITPLGLAPLKAKWRVSIAALLMRAAQLGYLSERGKKQAFMEINARRWRTREPVDIPLEKPQVFRSVLALLRDREPDVDLQRICGGIGVRDVAAAMGFTITDGANLSSQPAASRPRSLSMSKNPNIHTVQRDGEWVNVREGADRASSAHETQQQAIDRAREIATNSGVEHLIHGRDGRIRERNSYGNDPHPPKG